MPNRPSLWFIARRRLRLPLELLVPLAFGILLGAFGEWTWLTRVVAPVPQPHATAVTATEATTFTRQGQRNASGGCAYSASMIARSARNATRETITERPLADNPVACQEVVVRATLQATARIVAPPPSAVYDIPSPLGTPCPEATATASPSALARACATLPTRLRNAQRYIAQGARLATGQCGYGGMAIPPDPGKPFSTRAQVTLLIDPATCQVLVEVGTQQGGAGTGAVATESSSMRAP